MTEKSSNNEPGSAAQWYDLGCIYRKRGEFGHAVNAFRTAAEVAGEQLALLEDGSYTRVRPMEAGTGAR